MRARSRILSSLMIVSLLISTTALGESVPGPASTGPTTTVAAADPLLQLLVSKGVLNAEEAKSLVGTPEEQRTKLLELLRQKGILSASDYAELAPASAQVDKNLVASASPILPAAKQEKGESDDAGNQAERQFRSKDIAQALLELVDAERRNVDWAPREEIARPAKRQQQHHTCAAISECVEQRMRDHTRRP